MYLNKAMLIGNLTRDPEMRALPSGVSVASFSIATNRVWKDKDGNKQENTDFHNIVVFGRQAETISKYMKKGSMIFIEGRMQTRSWEQDGQKKYRTEIVAENFQFGPKGGNDSGESYSGGNGPSSNKKSSSNEGIDTIEYPEEEIDLNDIPF